MGLTAKQIYEISRLKTGVCAIYQKDWLETVLCQVDRAAHAEQVYHYVPSEDPEQKRSRELACGLLETLGEKDGGDMQEEQKKQMMEQILLCGMDGGQKKSLIQAVKAGKPGWPLCAEAVIRLLPADLEYPSSDSISDLQVWREEMLACIREMYGLEEPYAGLWLQAAVYVKASENPAWEKLYERIRKGTETDDSLKKRPGTCF